MFDINPELFKIRDPNTGEFKPLIAIRGESAYEAAVRLGYFTGTEDEFAQYLSSSSETLKRAEDVSKSITSLSISKVNDYLYDYYNPVLDYDYAINYFKNRKPDALVGACSSVRSGNFYGRNFDWLYSNHVEFVIKTVANNENHSTIGVSGRVEKLTKEFVESKLYDEAYKILPFMIVDGINDAGLVCNVNVVPLQKGKTTGTVPTVEQRYQICSSMLPRFILDRFSSATDAVDYIQKYVSVFVSTALHDIGYEVHFMVADKNDTYAIEFVENEIKIIPINNYPFMTNFYLYGIERNNDGNVYTPETQDASHNAILTNKITSMGSGLERYNLINSNINSANTKSGMIELMNKLVYTNTYKENTSPFWYTEYVGGNNTVSSDIGDFTEVIDKYIGYFESRQRDDGLTWHTAHSSVYDIRNKNLTLRNQEQSTGYIYEFNYFTKEEVMEYINTNSAMQNDSNMEILQILNNKANSNQIPTKLSQMQNDDAHNTVSLEEKQKWDNKSDFDGDYNSLSNKPSIPEEYNDTEIRQEIESKTSIDSKTIIRDGESKLQSSGTLLQNGGYQKYWSGTKAEFELIENKDADTIYEILDDVENTLFEVDGTSIEFSSDDILRIPTNVDLMYQEVLYGGGESGYRKFRNGRLEQWGVATTSIGETEFRIHQQYKDLNFSVFVEPREKGNFFHYAIPSERQKFKCRICGIDGTSYAVKVQWFSIGRWK